MLNPIEFKIIPHRQMRYRTCGDYFEQDGTIQFRVSDMGNDDYEFLVLIHEIVEQYLTQRRGITEESINEFDVNFEEERDAGLHSFDAEPGDDPKAPYRKEHFTATNIERMICEQLGVDWDKYSDTVNNL